MFVFRKFERSRYHVCFLFLFVGELQNELDLSSYSSRKLAVTHILGYLVCRLWNSVSRIFVIVEFCLTGLPDSDSGKSFSFWMHSAPYPVFQFLYPVSRMLQ